MADLKIKPHGEETTKPEMATPLLPPSLREFTKQTLSQPDLNRFDKNVNLNQSLITYAINTPGADRINDIQVNLDRNILIFSLRLNDSLEEDKEEEREKREEARERVEETEEREKKKLEIEEPPFRTIEVQKDTDEFIEDSVRLLVQSEPFDQFVEELELRLDRHVSIAEADAYIKEKAEAELEAAKIVEDAAKEKLSDVDIASKLEEADNKLRNRERRVKDLQKALDDIEKGRKKPKVAGEEIDNLSRIDETLVDRMKLLGEDILSKSSKESVELLKRSVELQKGWVEAFHKAADSFFRKTGEVTPLNEKSTESEVSELLKNLPEEFRIGKIVQDFIKPGLTFTEIGSFLEKIAERIETHPSFTELADMLTEGERPPSSISNDIGLIIDSMSAYMESMSLLGRAVKAGDPKVIVASLKKMEKHAPSVGIRRQIEELRSRFDNLQFRKTKLEDMLNPAEKKAAQTQWLTERKEWEGKLKEFVDAYSTFRGVSRIFIKRTRNGKGQRDAELLRRFIEDYKDSRKKLAETIYDANKRRMQTLRIKEFLAEVDVLDAKKAALGETAYKETFVNLFNLFAKGEEFYWDVRDKVHMGRDAKEMHDYVMNYLEGKLDGNREEVKTFARSLLQISQANTETELRVIKEFRNALLNQYLAGKLPKAELMKWVAPFLSSYMAGRKIDGPIVSEEIISLSEIYTKAVQNGKLLEIHKEIKAFMDGAVDLTNKFELSLDTNYKPIPSKVYANAIGAILQLSRIVESKLPKKEKLKFAEFFAGIKKRIETNIQKVEDENPSSYELGEFLEKLEYASKDVTAAAVDVPIDVKETQERAVEQFKYRNYENALKSFETLERANPESSMQYRFYIAVCLKETQKIKEAVELAISSAKPRDMQIVDYLADRFFIFWTAAFYGAEELSPKELFVNAAETAEQLASEIHLYEENKYGLSLPVVYLFGGKAWFYADEYSKGIDALSNAVRLSDPQESHKVSERDLFEMHYYRAYCYCRLSEFEKCNEDLKLAEKISKRFIAINVPHALPFKPAGLESETESPLPSDWEKEKRKEALQMLGMLVELKKELAEKVAKFALK
jgi:hypothetical protein